MHAANQERPTAPGPLIVIPCLNEAAHIGGLLDQLSPAAARLGGQIVVADGGSGDSTRRIVRDAAAQNPAIKLLDNPDRIQSAGINKAVAAYGQNARQLIRIDAHCSYPDDFCDTLLAEVETTKADSIVVSMIAEGGPVIQRINAVAQNSPVGNGGSKHRMRAAGEYVDHGHHALIDLDAFRAVGGYDPTFTHNEDAELDYRLRRAGYKIWLTAETVVTYFPRSSLFALARQYFNYGKGRARNLLKHRVVPKLRQAKVMLVLPALLLAALSGLHWIFAVPALLWLSYCLFAGGLVALRAHDITLVLTIIAAILMHVSWSFGFWREVLTPRRVADARALQ